jgi:hypothetical protein
MPGSWVLQPSPAAFTPSKPSRFCCLLRYLCTTCDEAGTKFNLCQACWDRFQEQAGGAGGSGGSGAGGLPLHDTRHAFQHVGPRMTRHNDYYDTRGGEEGGAADPSNPWGRSMNGGASLQRALRRLGDRYGVSQWMW